MKIPGKVFGGTAVKAGGADFSLQVFAPGTEGGFYHTHKEHEELYFFLSGEGEYQVDGTNIPVKEGSVVRVSPAGKRAVRNTGSTPLTMLCVQYVAAAPGSVHSERLSAAARIMLIHFFNFIRCSYSSQVLFFSCRMSRPTKRRRV